MLDIYKSFYKFQGEPFRLGPDHRFSYVHPSYANAMAYLEYAISQGEGFIAVTGEPGTGKTTLIRGLLAGLDKKRISVATLKNIQLDPDNLIEMVVNEFGLRVNNKSKSSLLLELEQLLKKQVQRGRRAVLIIDEAQGLSTASIEELRLLSNLQHDDRLLLQVFLVGQEELMDMIHSPGMEHLRQRLIAAAHLDRLGLEEEVAYIEHRLCHVGWQGDPAISEDALKLIHTCSLGVPRRINLICHRLFLYGGLNKKHTLVGVDVQHVVGELHRERVLTPDKPGEGNEPVTESEDESKPGLRLPRASSRPHIEEDSQKSSSPAPEPHPVDATQQSLSTSPVPEDGKLEQDRADTGSSSVPSKPDSGSKWSKYGRNVVILALLAGLLFVPVNETDIKDHLLNFISVALIKVESYSAMTETRGTEPADDPRASIPGRIDRIVGVYY
jgi:general secretion pathway protein A